MYNLLSFNPLQLCKPDYSKLDFRVHKKSRILVPCFEIYRHDGLKGLGHAILGNFSTDQMVIKLTKISK